MNKQETYKSSFIEEFLKEITPDEIRNTRKRMLLAARIDDAIKLKGWKRKDLAKALGKNSSEITKWLSGTHNFTTDTLFDLENILEIQLLRLENKPFTLVKTYIYRTTSQQVSEPADKWLSTINDKSSIPYYKAKGQINSTN